MHLDSPLLQQLYVYWDGKRRGRPYPARQDIDPLELGFILGSLILIEIEHHPLRFRYRLFGSEVARQQGFDMTGKYSEDHPWPDFAARTRSIYEEAMQQGTPKTIRRQGMIGDNYFDHQSLVLPLGNGRVEIILVGVVFSPLEQPAG